MADQKTGPCDCGLRACCDQCCPRVYGERCPKCEAEQRWLDAHTLNRRVHRNRPQARPRDGDNIIIP